MKSKSIFTSKTAVVGFVIKLAGLIAYFKPEVAQFVGAHAGVILMGIGWAAMLLRLATKGKVTLFAKDE